MDSTIITRQQRYRDRLKTEGKRQRVFFLSDAAMDQIKRIKEARNSPSINHVLEALLTDTPKYSRIVEQVKQLEDQYAIVSGQEFPGEAEKIKYLVELGKLIELAKTL